MWSRAACASARVGAATRATGSPTWRISSAARTGWSSFMRWMTFSPGTSVAVSTTTRLQSKVGSRSMPSRRAWGSVARTVLPCQAPGTTKSSVYRVAPSTLGTASTRVTDRGSSAGSGIRRAGAISGGVATGDADGAGVARGVRVGACVVMADARPSRCGYRPCDGRRPVEGRVPLDAAPRRGPPHAGLRRPSRGVRRRGGGRDDRSAAVGGHAREDAAPRPAMGRAARSGRAVPVGRSVPRLGTSASAWSGPMALRASPARARPPGRAHAWHRGGDPE